MRRSRRAWPLAITCIVIACGSSDQAPSGAARPSPFGPSTTLKRITQGGAPTSNAELWLDLVAPREDLRIVNVAVDLDGNGSFSANEWVVQNQPIRVDERTAILDVDLADPNLASEPARRVRVALSPDPIDAARPWNGDTPPAGEALELKLPFLPDEAVLVEGSPGTMAGGGGNGSLGGSLRPLGDPTVPPDAPKYESFSLDQSKAKIPSVKQEDGVNDCVGHAIGSGVSYLARRCPLKKPIAGFDVGPGAKEANILGLSHAVIDSYKKGGFFIEGKGGGVQSEKVLAGKLKFIGDGSLDGDIETTRVPADPTDFSGAGVWTAIRDALKKKTCAIEVGTQLFDKYGAQALKYGHMMAITGITTAGGATTIELLDSLRQDAHNNPDKPHPTKDQKVTFPPNGPPTVPSFHGGGETYRLALAFVLVECCKNPHAYLPPKDGGYNVRETGRTDPAGHAQYVGNPFAKPVTVALAGTTMTVDGEAPFVKVSGAFDDTSGALHLSGTGTVAGRPNVTVRMDAQVTDTGFAGSYVMGAGGELPTGQPFTVSFDATPL